MSILLTCKLLFHVHVCVVAAISHVHIPGHYYFKRYIIGPVCTDCTAMLGQKRYPRTENRQYSLVTGSDSCVPLSLDNQLFIWANRTGKHGNQSDVQLRCSAVEFKRGKIRCVWFYIRTTQPSRFTDIFHSDYINRITNYYHGERVHDAFGIFGEGINMMAICQIFESRRICVWFKHERVRELYSRFRESWRGLVSWPSVPPVTQKSTGNDIENEQCEWRDHRENGAIAVEAASPTQKREGTAQPCQGATLGNSCTAACTLGAQLSVFLVRSGFYSEIISATQQVEVIIFGIFPGK